MKVSHILRTMKLRTHLWGSGLSNIRLKPSVNWPNSSANFANLVKLGRVKTSDHALSESHSGAGLGYFFGMTVPPAIRCLHSS